MEIGTTAFLNHARNAVLAAKVSTKPTTADGVSTVSNDGPAVTIMLSADAKAHLAKVGAADPSNAPLSVREKLDQQYKDAAKAGTSITFDTAKPGRVLDMSKFSTSELAEMAKGPKAGFTQDEMNLAKGNLTEKLRVTLEPFDRAGDVENDSRASIRAVSALYDSMSDDLRAALNWTPEMRAGTDEMIRTIDEDRKSKSNSKDVRTAWSHGQIPGGLDTDAALQYLGE